MRDIEFRGKRKDNGEWVFGFYAIDKFGRPFVFPNNSEAVVVIPETVGQYTGLKDRNGVKVFEGDILQNKTSGDGIPRFIRWCNKLEYCGWMLGRHTKNAKIEIGDMFLDINFVNSEVIGNIHDNPEGGRL